LRSCFTLCCDCRGRSCVTRVNETGDIGVAKIVPANVRFVKSFVMLAAGVMTVMGIVPWYAAFSPSCRWRLAWGALLIILIPKKQKSRAKGKKVVKARRPADSAARL